MSWTPIRMSPRTWKSCTTRTHKIGKESKIKSVRLIARSAATGSPTVQELGGVARSNNLVSFVSERHNGIDAHGSPGGWVSGKQCDGQKQEGDPDEREAIDGMESIEDAAQQIRGSNSENHSDKQSNKHGPNAFAEDESEDVALLSADSHADADFARAEDDHIADRTPDAHRGQQKPEQAHRGRNSGRKGGTEKRRRLAKHLRQSGSG